MLIDKLIIVETDLARIHHPAQSMILPASIFEQPAASWVM
jgi:hypothetical protein